MSDEAEVDITRLVVVVYHTDGSVDTIELGGFIEMPTVAKKDWVIEEGDGLTGPRLIGLDATVSIKLRAEEGERLLAWTRDKGIS